MDTGEWQGQKLNPPKAEVPFLPHRLMDPTASVRTFVNELGFFLVARPLDPSCLPFGVPAFVTLIRISSPLSFVPPAPFQKVVVM